MKKRLTAFVIMLGVLLTLAIPAYGETPPARVLNTTNNPEDSGGGNNAVLSTSPNSLFTNVNGYVGPVQDASEANVRTGTMWPNRDYWYTSVDKKGNIHVYRLFRSDRVDWKIVTDSSGNDQTLYLRWVVAGFALYRNGSLYCGVTGHHTRFTSRWWPYPTGAIPPGAGNDFPKDVPISGCTAWDANQVNATQFKWQLADTRWLREVSKTTIKLPPGETFCYCGPRGSEGKNSFTFSTTIDLGR